MNLYTYLDYRKYLNDFYSTQKAVDLKFSYGAFAKKVDISSRGLLKLIVDGKRGLSQTNIDKINRGLHSTKSQKEFFDTLVKFNQAKDFDAKNKYFELLCKFPQRRKIFQLDKERYEYFSNWLYPTLKQLTLLKDAPKAGDQFSQWAYERLGRKATLSEIELGVKKLIKLNLIQIVKQSYKPTEKALFKPSGIPDAGVRRAQKDLILQSVDALNDPIEKRDISGITLALREKDIQEIKKIIDEFTLNLNFNYSTDEPADAVYRFNIQFFELSRSLEKEPLQKIENQPPTKNESKNKENEV